MTHDAWRMTHDACMTAISESNLGPVHIYGTGYEHITHLCGININLVSYSKKSLIAGIEPKNTGASLAECISANQNDLPGLAWQIYVSIGNFHPT